MSSTVPARVRCLVFCASLRRDSLNGRLARLAAEAIEANGCEADLAEMTEFAAPSYDADAQAGDGFPPAIHRLRERLLANDAFAIASPEYNASMPGALKNSIDWASRLAPQPFDTRHGLLMSASPSMAGGNRGLWALRMPLEHLGARVYPDMFSLAQAHQAFDGDGHLADPVLADRFAETIAGFMDLAEAAKHYPCIRREWVEYLGERADPAIDRVE